MSKLREQMCLAERGIGQIEFAEYLVDAAEEIVRVLETAKYRHKMSGSRDFDAALEELDKKLNGER